MSRCIEHARLDRSADTQHYPRTEADIDARDATACTGMREDFRARGGPQTLVAADMVAVFVGIEDAADLPTPLSRCRQAGLPVERIHGHRLARFFTSDEVVVIAPRVSRPNALDDHLFK